MQEIQKYQLTDAMIGEAKDKFLKLTISGVDDSAGLKAVHSARMTIKNWRIDVEKARKAEKARILEYGKALDSEARRLTDLLTPIEDHLDAEEKRVTEEKARLKAEREAAEAEMERKRQERIYMRIGLLAEYGDHIGPSEAEALTDDEYNARLSKAMEDHTARMRAEQEALDAEQARLEQIRLEQVAERERIAEDRRIIEEEKRAMAAEKAAREAEEWERQKIRMQEALEAESTKVVKVCEETKERIEEVRALVNEEMQKAAIPPAELPSVIEMINEYRDHVPAFLQDPPKVQPVDFEIMHRRFQVHTTPGGVFHFQNAETLFDAIGQWIDNDAGEGDTLEIMVFRMTDSQYSDLLKRSPEGNEE